MSFSETRGGEELSIARFLKANFSNYVWLSETLLCSQFFTATGFRKRHKELQ